MLAISTTETICSKDSGNSTASGDSTESGYSGYSFITNPNLTYRQRMTVAKKSLQPNSFITDPNSEIVKINHKHMNREDVKALAGELEHCKNLLTLDLSGNHIGDDGAKALASGLEHCKNLHTLHLSGNYIGDDGAKALAGGLEHCKDLRII